MKIPARNKYKAVRTKLDGHIFDSKREAAFYADLRNLERGGKVSCIECHPVFPLRIDRFGQVVEIGKYTADFRFVDDVEGRSRVVDVKSPSTAKGEAFRLRKKLAEALHGIIIEVIM